MNKIFSYVFIFVTVFAFFHIGYSEDKRLSASATLKTSVDFSYSYTEGWLTGFPLYGMLYLNYKYGITEARGGIRYEGSLYIDDLYIKGGSLQSYMKIGNFRTNWDVSRTVNILTLFSPIDDFYPNNIFYRKMLVPTPALEITFSGSNMVQDFILSGNNSFENINESLLGFKSTAKSNNNRITIGVIRKIGFPPPNYFLQLVGIGNNIREWIEVSWVYKKDSRDKWTGLIGIEKSFNENIGDLELIFFNTQSLLYAGNNIVLANNITFNLSLFISLNDWSSAWKSSFDFKVNKNFYLTLGGYLFLGKEGKYFSPEDSSKNNNNRFYMALTLNV